MFYSESLLSKTGPLARVWLASNLDRKLTKQNVLASKLEDNVKDIIGGGQAPMALRLSSQLLLGVCKIYNRKATYLMDDCSEALLKIKMAFRPGNVDLPSNQSHKANPHALLLPDTITELDLFAPLPDPDDFLAGHDIRAAPGQDPTLLDYGMSQMIEIQTPTTNRQEKRLFPLDEPDLDLDLGDDLDLSRSIEMGRRAESVRPDQPSFLLEADDLDLDLGNDDLDTTIHAGAKDTTLGDPSLLPINQDEPMTGIEPQDAEIEAANAAALARADAARLRRMRDSESPLSSIAADEERELDDFYNTTIEDPSIIQAAAQQRIKRRKVMTMDTETELDNPTLRAQQEDRSAITMAPTFLPRDPLLLQLMEMQRNGTFVSNLLGDGYLRGMAPELRGILSLEIIRKAGEKKRKRDSGVADLEVTEDEDRQATPQLDIPQDEDDFGAQGAPTPAPQIFSDDLPEDETLRPMDDGNNTFDVTEAPLLHPAQSGPVAIGTKKMVHLLREHFAPGHSSTSTGEAPTPSKRTQSSALFTDICPEGRTSRDDATKMFFELLVLGTKDAIKVEQPVGEVGGPLRVRGKRGLWGNWAEMGTGSTQAESQAQAVGAAA